MRGGTYQINLIKLHLDPILQRKHHPTSPRHLDFILCISPQDIPHGSVEHNLIIRAEEDLRGNMTTRGNVCPEAVAEGEDFYLVSVVLVPSFQKIDCR